MAAQDKELKTASAVLGARQRELLATWLESLRSLDGPEFADLTAMLKDISASRAQQGFSPSEAAD